MTEQEKKDYMKKYYENNKERLKEMMKTYQKENKEKLNEYRKDFYKEDRKKKKQELIELKEQLELLKSNKD